MDRPTGFQTREQFTLTTTDATFFVERNPQGGIAGWVDGPLPTRWRLNFFTGADVELRVGEYLNATRWPFASFVGLDISGGGGCNVLTGRFRVLEVVYGDDGSVLKFAVDAEQHCEDGDVATFVAFRYDSSLAATSPFGGAYPTYRFSINPASGGIVTGSGIACGGGHTDCSEDYASPQVIDVTATPDPGFIFGGWVGACSGGEVATVRVNSVESCSPTFAPVVPPAPRNYFIAIAESNDPVLDGRSWVNSTANSIWSVSTVNSRSIVRFQIVGPGNANDTWWSVEFGAPTGQAVTPGTYLHTGGRPWPLAGSLSVSVDSMGCSSPDSRYLVHEAEYAGETLTRFSADAEMHCWNRVLFISIRYRSSMEDIRPFAGAFPDYRLQIVPPVNGTVTGGGINCGAGGTSCEWTGATAAEIALTASPEPGYLFAGWGGYCSGTATTAVLVNSVKYCRADFVPLVPASPRTLLIADSMPGDPVGGGLRAVHSTDNSVWQVSTQLNARRISIMVTTGENSYWSIQLDAPEGSVLGPGSYPHATRSPFARFNGLSVSANTSCNELTGRFIVHELTISDGQVQSLSADVEQHCNDATAALFLAVRYRASYAEHRPFGGNYPRYELTVTPSPHGSVMGDAIDCGADASACALSSASARIVTLTATPDNGYVFAGWTGGCSGAETTSIVLNSVKHCQARFERAMPTAARTLAVFTGEPGHYVSAGQKRVFSPSNSLWSVSRTSSGNTITVRIHAREGARENLWTLSLSAPSGSALQTGAYSVPASYSSTAPRLGFSGDGRGCTDTGTFTIRQLSTDPLTGAVTRLDVEFEHHCYDLANPRMIGSVQYRSTVDVVAFHHDINGDGRLDLFWQHGRDGWIASWEMQGTRLLRARTTTPDRVADTSWQIISTADFNADGRPDLFWQNRQTGLMAVWYMDGSTYLGPGRLSNNTVSDLNWQIRAIADFNGDSSPDLLWQHDLTGMLVVWVLDGVRLVEARVLSPSTVSDIRWKIAGAADFNADGHQDLLWRNRATGELVVWYMNGTALTSGAPLSPGVVADPNWEIRALADINGDGFPDLIWQRRSDGWLSAWLMNGVTMSSGAGFDPAQVTDTAWRIVGPR